MRSQSVTAPLRRRESATEEEPEGLRVRHRIPLIRPVLRKFEAPPNQKHKRARPSSVGPAKLLYHYTNYLGSV